MRNWGLVAASDLIGLVLAIAVTAYFGLSGRFFFIPIAFGLWSLYRLCWGSTDVAQVAALLAIAAAIATK